MYYYYEEIIKEGEKMADFGSYVEYQIALYLCGKKYFEIDNHWKRIIKMMFPMINDDSIIYCEKVQRGLKQDIFIVVEAIKKTISIKSGVDVTVHCEEINSFCKFLKSIGISDYNIETLRLYHYGDETIDGTGTIRQNVQVLKDKYEGRIAKFNEEANKYFILKNIMERVLSFGTLNQHDHVDYLYFGNLEKGELYDMDDLIQFFSIKHLPEVKSIHFGTFVYCPFYRFLSSNNKDEKDRHYSAIRWFRIDIDLDKFVKYHKKIRKYGDHYSSSLEII